jgi:hypothetical protein
MTEGRTTALADQEVRTHTVKNPMTTSPRDRDARRETEEIHATMMTCATKDLRVTREILAIHEIREIIATRGTHETTGIVTIAIPTMTRRAAAAETTTMKKSHEGVGRRWSTVLIQSLCAETTANDGRSPAGDGATTTILMRRVTTTIVDPIDHDVRLRRLDGRVDTTMTMTANMMIVAMGEADEMETATRTSLRRKSRSATTSKLKCT